MDTIHWGVLGPGRIAHAFAKGLAVIEGGKLYASASRDLERAKSFNARYGAERAYASYEELVNDPRVDAVYVATPHNFHYAHTKLALEAGKAVLCEKPFTVNAREAKELIELARAKNLFLMEAVWTRYLPIFKVVREWLDSGAIGEVIHVSSTIGFCVPRVLEGRMFNHDLAGGALLDLGLYPVSTSQWIFRRNPQSFRADVFLGETQVDEVTHAILNYGNGVSSTFCCSLLGRLQGDMQIAGTKGTIRIHPQFWCSKIATISRSYDSFETVERPFLASGFEYEIEAAMKAMRAGAIEEPTMPHADTLGNMELADAIRASANFRYRFEK